MFDFDGLNAKLPAKVYSVGPPATLWSLDTRSPLAEIATEKKALITLNGNFWKGGEFSGVFLYCNVDFGFGIRAIGDFALETVNEENDAPPGGGSTVVCWKKGMFIRLDFAQLPGSAEVLDLRKLITIEAGAPASAAYSLTPFLSASL